MTDQVFALPGDELTREHLAEYLGRTGISDYVERGLDIHDTDVDYGAAVVDIPGGKCFIIQNGRDSMLFADPRAGVELATDGVNHVFIYYDLNQPDGEKIGFHVSSSTPPQFPHLLIAEIDMGAQSVERQNQTAPVYRRNAITYKGNDIDSDGDGMVDAAETAQHADTASDAVRLGGAPPTAYARRGQGEDITARWMFEEGFDTTNFAVRQNGSGLQFLMGADGDGDFQIIRPNAPGFSGSDRDLQFHNGEWELEGNPRAGGSRILTNADKEMFTEPDQTETIGKRWDFRNGFATTNFIHRNNGYGFQFLGGAGSGKGYQIIRPEGPNHGGGGRDLAFHNGEWNIEGNPKAGGVEILTNPGQSLEITGDRVAVLTDELELPTVTGRPADAEPGTIIYRKDRD